MTLLMPDVIRTRSIPVGSLLSVKHLYAPLRTKSDPDRTTKQEH